MQVFDARTPHCLAAVSLNSEHNHRNCLLKIETLVYLYYSISGALFLEFGRVFVKLSKKNWLFSEKFVKTKF